MSISNATRVRFARVVRIGLLLFGLMLFLPGIGRAEDLSSQTAGPWSQVSVTDPQGWTLREVTLAWDAGGRMLVVVRADGAEKLIAPDEVTMVVDREGLDITALVLAGPLAAQNEWTPPPAAPSGGNPEFESAPASPAHPHRGAGRLEPGLFVVAGDFGGGWDEPTGDWFWGLENGGFVQGGLRLSLSERRYLHLVYRHQSLGTRTFYAYDFFEPVITDWSLDSYQVLLGGYSRLNPSARIRSVTYLEGGAGVMRVTTDTAWGDASISRFAFAAQAGLWLLVSDDLALDVGLHLFYKPGWVDGDEVGGASLGLHLAGMLLH